jgi:glycosyltransferase involved in cell wall biosynthesis
MKEPLISIIIPVYNRAELIKETLDSVLAQTYSNWECLVVDDGSKDNSYEVAADFSKNDLRINVLRRPNTIVKGAPACRQLGLNNAKGEYIIFLDSDDLLAPWALEERMSIFLKQPDLDVIISNGAVFNTKTQRLLGYSTIYGVENVLERFLQLDIVFQTTSPTWKRSFLEENKVFWDTKLLCWQDVDFAIQAFSRKPNFFWGRELPDYFLRKEEDPNAITSSMNVVINAVDNFYTYEKWIQKLELRKSLETNFPDYMLNKLEYLLSDKDLNVMLRMHSGLLKKHLGKKAVRYLKIFNYTRKLPGLRSFVYRSRWVVTKCKRRPKNKEIRVLSPEMKFEIIRLMKENQSTFLEGFV